MSDTPREQQRKGQTIVATSGDVKVVTPRRVHHGSVRNLLEDPDDIVREQFGGFVKFLRDHAVVGVAIGFIVGLQAQTLIKQLVDSFVTPLLTLLVGPDLQNKRLVLHNAASVSFAWGKF